MRAGLYYYNARWYDPQLGRFITEDPIKDGSNWHVYCGNNPINYIDPTGLSGDFFDDFDYNDDGDVVYAGTDEEVTYYDEDGNEDDDYEDPYDYEAQGGRGLDALIAEADEWNAIIGKDYVSDYSKAVNTQQQFKQIGLGLSVGLVIGLGLEIGIAWDSSKKKSPYITMSAGFFVGATTNLTGAYAERKGTVKSMDDKINKTAIAAAGPMFSYDLDNNGKMNGFGVLGAGGGTMVSITATKETFVEFAESIKNYISDGVSEIKQSIIDASQEAVHNGRF